MPFELRLEQFSGPLEKLLELIEAQKLEITDISLAKVTDDFLSYVKGLEQVDTALLADFIWVASRLIFLKSKALLPDFELTAEEEAGIHELEERLLVYREFRPALKSIAQLWRGAHKEFGRPYFLHLALPSVEGKGAERFFYPGRNCAPAALREALRKLFKTLEDFILETKTIKETIVTIEEKIKEVIDRLGRENEVSLSRLSRARPIAEIIAMFLAILHLVHERAVVVEQKDNFSDIIVRKGTES